ncbi:MAG: V-type ATP synthase subunit D [Firmicutes bacterium]|nr:V-type ATP synthase subunit D [Bacillota bacterium]
MAERLNVNPTRMELARQKSRLRTATRGHKLLKDKSDEMIRHFIQIAKENKRLREQVDGEIANALRLFTQARIQMTSQEIEAAVMASTATISISPSNANIMGLVVPKLVLDIDENAKANSLINTSSTFDESIRILGKLMEKLLTLAEVEKTCDMLAAEIVKIKRRINALEFILMPQIQSTIKFIRMKLAENERSQLVRVMKVKAQMQDK